MHYVQYHPTNRALQAGTVPKPPTLPNNSRSEMKDIAMNFDRHFLSQVTGPINGERYYKLSSRCHDFTYDFLWLKIL